MKYKFYKIEIERDEVLCPICKTKLLDNCGVLSTTCEIKNCEFNSLLHLAKKKLVLTDEEYKEYTKANSGSIWSVSYWVKKGYSEEDAKFKVSEYQKSNNKKANDSLTVNNLRATKAKTLKKFIDSGETLENAQILTSKKWKNVGITFTPEYWMNKGMDLDSAKNKIAELQKSGRNSRSKNIQEFPDKYAKTFNTKIEYWKNLGYSDEDAKDMLNKRQTTFSKEICISKYGEDVGLKIWQTRQEKWKNTIFDEHGAISKGLSKISMKFIDDILKRLPIDIHSDCKYGDNELCFRVFGKKRAYKYDFCYKKFIIEFNGDFWHANPKLYEYDDILNYPGKKILASDIWERDIEKNECAQDYGYTVYTVWEGDYKENPEYCVDNCLKFLGFKNE